MLLHSHRYLIITILSFFVLIGAVVAWYILSTPMIIDPRINNNNNSVTSAPIVAPEELLQKYRDSLNGIISRLEPILNRKLEPSDGAELVKLKGELLTLMVPQNVQEFHLNLVLKISKLVDLFKPARMASVAKESTAITNAQTSLKNLLKQAP